MFLFLSFSFLLALPLHAQSQGEIFVEISRQVEVGSDTVAEEAIDVAKEKKYLREITPTADPTALIAGDVHLRIDEIPFTLYLRSTNHHTEAHLESHKMEVSERVKREAEEFLQEVVDRATSKHG